MFNTGLIRELRKENARLRAQLRAEQRRYDELLDRTLFSVRPERVITVPKNGTPAYQASDAGDLYTKAMQDAAERARQEAGKDDDEKA